MFAKINTMTITTMASNNAMTSILNNTKTIRIMDGMNKLAEIEAKARETAMLDTRADDRERAELLALASVIEMGQLLAAVDGINARDGVVADAVKAAVCMNIRRRLIANQKAKQPTPFMSVWLKLANNHWAADDELWVTAAEQHTRLLAELAVRDRSNEAFGKKLYLNGTTLRWGKNSYSMRAVTKALSTMAVDRQQVVVLSQANKVYKGHSAVTVAFALVAGGVELGGLVSNPSHAIAVRLNQDKTAKVLKDLWSIPEDHPEYADAKAAATALEAAGYLPALNAEGYAESGYIQHRTTLLPADGQNVFGKYAKDGTGILSPESAKKLVVRLTKQIKRADEVYNTKMRTVFVAGIKGGTIGLETRRMLDSFAECGAGYMNDAAWDRFGGIRAVGHSKGGQKLVAGHISAVHPAIRQALSNVLVPNQGQPLVVVPVTSVKSTTVKDLLALQWKQVVLANGDAFQYAVVEEVDYSITDFYAMYNFEVVPTEEMGIAALRLALTRRLVSSQGASVTTMVMNAMNEGWANSVRDVLLSLEADGIIRRKKVHGKTNLQMLQSMEADYGRKQTEAFIRALRRTPMARKTRSDATLVNLFLKGVDPVRVHSTTLANVVKGLGEMLEEIGVKGDEFCPTIPATVAASVMAGLMADGKDWVEITHGNAKVLMPSGQRLIRSVNLEANTAKAVTVEGYAADVFKALWFAIHQGLNGDIGAVTIAKLADARDGVLGKQLAQVAGFGANGAIVPHWNLQYGQVASPALSAAKAEAEAFYGESCRGVWSKAPNILSLAVAGVDIVDLLWDEEDDILCGSMIYANADFILIHEDDCDGDRAAVLLAPKSALFKGKLGSKAKRPTDSRYNPMAAATREYMAGERAGFYVTTGGRRSPVSLITWAELTEAVVESVQAKANVGIFTSAQQKVQTHSWLAARAVEAALTRSEGFVSTLALNTVCPRVARGLDIPVLTADQVKGFGMTFVNKVITPAQGAATQADAMKRIKQVSGVQLVVLAEKLGPQQAQYGYMPVTDKDALELAKAGGLSAETMAGLSEDEVIAMIRSFRLKARAEKQKELMVAAKTMYRFNAAEISCVKYLAKLWGISNPDLINALVIALMQVAVSSVGRFRHDVIDRNEAIFGNDNLVAKAGGLDGIKGAGAGDTLQGRLLALLAYKA